MVGYSDRWSVAAGESVKFMLSVEDETAFTADLVRLRHGDPRPQSPGLREDVVRHLGTYPGRRQLTSCGSYIHVGGRAGGDAWSAVSVQAWIWPTAPTGGGEQGVISGLPDGGWGLGIDESGHLTWWLGHDGARVRAAAEEPMRSHEWYFVAAAYDAARRRARLWQQPLATYAGDPSAGQVATEADVGQIPVPAHGLMLGALAARPDRRRRTRATGHLNGKLDSPRMFVGHALDDDEVRALTAGQPAQRVVRNRPVVEWDLGAAPHADRVPDCGPLQWSGTVINGPTRAVTGHDWDGRELDFRRARGQYGAIHFHDDDLDDAEWQPDVDLALPHDLASGVYAARIRTHDAEDRIPFFVTPPADTATADVAVLFPTLTYLAYGNQRGQFDDAPVRSGLFGRDLRPDPLDVWLDGHPELGGSLYDLHGDGSGICHASRRRPILNLRPNHLNWVMHAPRHFPADLYLVDWLDHEQIRFDALTDEDLHTHGQPLLDRYQVVLTGSHPEYHTERMLDAVDGYVADGGRLMYLGGNGFYWVTSIDPTHPYRIEVRRGTSGTRVWESRAGECHHATNGEPGGLWRHRGRPPNALLGVGFAAEGWDQQAGSYLRTPISHEPEYRWIFAGIDDDAIGDFGLVMGGTVGDEIDRCDHANGSPAHTVVLATSTPSSPYYQPATEDVLMVTPGLDGTANADVRADMTFLRRGDGAVFSVSSICWIGALCHNDYDNNVSQLTRNVLHGFRTRAFDASAEA